MTTQKTKMVAKVNNLQPQTMTSTIIELVSRKDFDVEKVEKMIGIHSELERKAAEKDYMSAMSQFQGTCPIIKQTSRVNFNSTDYSYAGLDEMVHTIKPYLFKNGLSFSFNLKDENDMAILITTISHESGTSRESTYKFNPLDDGGKMNSSQKRKSALTYAKRAGLENALGLVTAGEDDDARRCLDNQISVDEIKLIESMLDSTNTDLKDLKKHFNFNELSELSELESKKIIRALKQKRNVLSDRSETNV